MRTHLHLSRIEGRGVEPCTKDSSKLHIRPADVKFKDDKSGLVPIGPTFRTVVAAVPS